MISPPPSPPPPEAHTTAQQATTLSPLWSTSATLAPLLRKPSKPPSPKTPTPPPTSKLSSAPPWPPSARQIFGFGWYFFSGVVDWGFCWGFSQNLVAKRGVLDGETW